MAQHGGGQGVKCAMDSDHIEVVDYDPTWPSRFESEQESIARAFGPRAVDIQHVGSTAVMGLPAKPVIDILLAVEDMSRPHEVVNVMTSLGYTNVPHDEDDRRLFFCKGMPRSHHVHVVKQFSWTYWKHIIFREYLRENEAAREEYALLKRQLADAHRHDRAAYVAGKTAFIEGALQESIIRHGQSAKTDR